MHTNFTKILAVTALAFLAAAPELFAQVPGKITNKEGKSFTGTVRWMSASKKYVIATKSANGANVNVELSPDNVKKIEVAKPQQLDAALAAIKGGNAAAAIPVLDKIVTTYEMLQWDEPAARALASAKVQAGDAEGAIKVCEKLTAAKPELAYLGEVAPVYWAALLKADKTAKLSSLLSKAISQGDAAASAAALVMRGNIYFEQKKYNEALKDGYLRVVILYEGVKDVQPEALFKAARAFDSLNQSSNAEKMRSKLRTKYATSEYARKL